MTSRSKGGKVKAFFHQKFFSKKGNKAASNDPPDGPLIPTSNPPDSPFISISNPPDGPPISNLPQGLLIPNSNPPDAPLVPTPNPTDGPPIPISDPPSDPPDGTANLSSPASSPDVAVVMEELSPILSLPEVALSESPNEVAALFQASSPGPSTFNTTSSGSMFSNASYFSVHNPTMVDRSTYMTVNVSCDKRSKVMKHLSRHTIRGAAHDSSARGPPPRCHPGTRIEINEHIFTWFYDEGKQDWLIWVYGPAGVGKSAIMQTLAEKLVESKHLGASVFISRPNGRNVSRHLFLTVSYQLAMHIEEYCVFITEKLSRDPELVDKGIEEQFKILIVEPFVEKKIGAGAKPWGILLDGLDELDEPRSQREVIRLIADFVVKHPDAPLLWAIASRPEPHISDTFDEEEVVPAYWKKRVPANSQQSNRDVEHFLRDNLGRIRKEFPRTVPKKWPSEEQILSLAAVASGLFIFAATAIRFIEDPRYASPAMRLDQLLSTLNGRMVTSQSHPLAHLDTLYTSILSAIPPEIWPTTKRVLGTLLYAQGEGERQVLRILASTAIVLGLDLSIVYASVNGCYSLINVSDPENANFIPVTFYHASFGEYLLDATRSQDFYISLGDVEEELLKSSLKVWHEFKVNHPPTVGLTYEKRSLKYFSSLISEERTSPNFTYQLMRYIHEALLTFLVDKHDPKKGAFSSEEDRDLCFNLLSQLEDATLSYTLWGIAKLSEFLPWLFDVWEIYQDALVSKGSIQKVALEQVQFSQVGTYPAHMHLYHGKSQLKEYSYNMVNLHEILHHISHLQSSVPHLPVLACGSPGNGCLIFRHQVDASDLKDYDLDPLVSPDPIWRYFSIPFTQSDFYRDVEHFLKADLERIQTKYSQVVPPTWPTKEQFSKLAGAVAHNPAFAQIALQFIENTHSGNPILHLDQLLVLIDGVDPSDDQPFIYVDALYMHILDSIPSDMWPITQQVLGVLLNTTAFLRAPLKSPKGISIVLGIEMNVVHAAIKNCHPLVLTSPGDLSLGPITFFHTSFCEYLTDSTRSKNFCIPTKQSLNKMLEALINNWLDFKEQCDGVSDRSKWDEYCSRYHSDMDPSNHLMVSDFNYNLLHDIHEALTSITQYGSAELESKQIRDRVFRILSQLDSFAVSTIFWHRTAFINWLFVIWDMYHVELTSTCHFEKIQFQNLKIDHLESGFPHTLIRGEGEDMKNGVGKDPRSEEEIEEYLSGLRLFQQHRPELQVLIGGIPGGRFALFEYEYTEEDLEISSHYTHIGKLEWGDRGYYVIPYPDEE